MSSNLVIVAIPEEGDRVWKVSSEKVPHLTLLFLGDAGQVSNLDQIVQFVEHAATTSLRRFYLPVDYRGELGADKADVLFFKTNRYDVKAVRDFRSLLLKDSNIKTAYDSTSQFETPATVGSPGQPWIPHLTLGYPDSPAKPIPDNEISNFFDVCFDRIAVWTSDFEGPEFRLQDYWGEFNDEMDDAMTMPMSALSHAAKVSDTPWSNFKDSDYTDEQYARACLLDRGESAGTAKQRYGIPVREPDGTLNRNACHAAAAVLSSKGGTGSARGNKVKGSPEQIAAARKKLVALYNGPLGEDVPDGLGASMKQTVDLGSKFVLEHYGVKGMRWGVRKAGGSDNTTGQGETKREGLQRYLDPQGHNASTDVIKTTVGIMVPIVAPITVPAQIRLIRGGARAASAKLVDMEEKKFQAKAMSEKNFVEIHNRSGDRFNREIGGINQKYPGDLTKNPTAQKRYDDEVQKLMQDSYQEAARSIGNKNRTMHLDIQFQPNGLDFKIQAKEGRPKPIAKRMQQVKHAADDEIEFEVSLDITGKIQRDNTGHIIGFTFDGAEMDQPEPSVAQTADLGREFLEHYGVKGMRWGQRKEEFVTRQHQKALTTEMARRAKRPAQDIRTVATIGTTKRAKSAVGTAGGEDHPPTPDAIKIAEHKQKYKKSGAAALTNNELSDMQRRLNLENDVARLMRGQQSSGQRFVEGLLGRGSKDDRRSVESKAGQATQDFLLKSAAKKAGRMGVKVATGL